MRDRETRGEKVGGRTMVRRGSKMFRRVKRMWDNLEENCREDVIFFSDVLNLTIFADIGNIYISPFLLSMLSRV